MNRREFGRNLLLGAGELTLLTSSPQLLATSLWPHRASRAKAGSLSVQIGKTVEITRSRDRCWFPSLHQFANKDLIATMSMHADSTHPDEGFLEAYCISHDGGVTWSQRSVSDALGGLWSEVSDGTVWGLSAHIIGQEGDQDFHFSRAQLSGAHANAGASQIKVDRRKDARLHMQQPTQGVMFTGSILPTDDGGLIACVYSRTKQAPKYYHVACARSGDHGETWHEDTIIASVPNVEQPPQGMGKDGPCEAGLVRLRDGRLFVIYRTGSDGYLGTAWSSDEGHTWTPPTVIPFKGVEPRVRLLSNGVLACSTGRPGPVTMMFSLDGTGKSWSHETVIFSDMSTRYTEFLELAPGKLFLVYDSVPYGWKEIPSTDTTSQNVIYGTYLDVELHS